MLRIALNVRDQTFERTKSLGILNFSLGLARALTRSEDVAQLTVFTNRELGELAGPVRAGLRYVGLEQPAPRGRQRVLWDQWGVSEACDASNADWLLLPKGFPPLARWPRARVCCVLQDDIVVRRPESTWSLRGEGEKRYFGAMLRRALTKADLLVSSSRFTAEQFGRVASPKRVVVPVGIGFEAVPMAQAPERREHLLLLTSTHAHKLTAEAISWLSRWDDMVGRKYRIVGVGALPPGVEWPRRDHWVRHTRPVDSAYAELMQRAIALLYFSAYEGYGMPPREALQAGVWTLASDLPPLREDVPGDLLFQRSYDAFAAKLTDIVSRSLAGLPPPEVRLPTWGEVATKLTEAMKLAGRAS
jgi:hypothetical protein